MESEIEKITNGRTKRGSFDDVRVAFLLFRQHGLKEEELSQTRDSGGDHFPEKVSDDHRQKGGESDEQPQSFFRDEKGFLSVVHVHVGVLVAQGFECAEEGQVQIDTPDDYLRTLHIVQKTISTYKFLDLFVKNSFEING